MDILEAIRSRRSVRAFKPAPVPKETLREVLETALWAPSWANTQPWEFAVVGGLAAKEIKARLLEKLWAEEEHRSDIPHPTFSGVYQERRRELGMAIHQTLGIRRDDREGRRWWDRQMVKFFGAPNGIIFYMDGGLGHYSMLDIGALMQTVMLAAQAHGLGCCPEAAMVRHPEVLREILGIPESKKIVCGMAIGYPDADSPISSHRSHRVPLEEVSTWHGFD